MIFERLAVIDGKVFVLVIVIEMHFLFVAGCLTCSLVRVVSCCQRGCQCCGDIVKLLNKENIDSHQ